MNAYLTRRQQDIYDFLCDYYMSSEIPLTLDELCQAIGMKSRGSMHKHIQALVASGLVQPANKKQRGIRLTNSPSNLNNPIYLRGTIAAGSPIQAFDNPEIFDVPDQLTGKGSCFILQVKGESMIEDGILDGDWVVIEQRNHARNGEIVVALVDGHDATLKHIEQKPGEIILHPANSSMESMHYLTEQVEIQGVLVGQMRSYN